MSQLKATRQDRATPVTHGVAELKRFRPIAAQARTAIDGLIGRGAVPVSVREDLVVLRRMNQLAQVDAFGRVSWGS